MEASFLHTALPIPPEAPVTIAVLPFQFIQVPFPTYQRLVFSALPYNSSYGTDNRHKVRVTFRPALDDRVAVLRILICVAFHYAAQMFHEAGSVSS